MGINGSHKAKARRLVEIGGVQYIVLREAGRRMLLYKLAGDDSDYRLRLGYTQVKMAKKLGITQGSLSKFETGITEMPAAMKRKLQQMLAEADHGD